MNWFYILIGGLAVLLITLFIAGTDGTILGLSSWKFAQLGSLIAVGVFVGLGTFYNSNFSTIVKQLGVWLLLLLLLLVGYSFRFEATIIYNRVVGTLIPGVAINSTSGDEVVINRSNNGHFQVRATINDDVTIRMLVDTGATGIILSAEDAEALGYETASLSYTYPVSTANGDAYVAPASINSIAVGSIRLDGFRVLISPPGQLDESLLGLAFLNELSSYEVSNDRLVLRP